MDKLIEKINAILAEWDPIGVGYNISLDEYKGYIPSILKFISSKKELMDYLEIILVNEMGLEYNSKNKDHVNSLNQICDKIIKVYQSNI